MNIKYLKNIIDWVRNAQIHIYSAHNKLLEALLSQVLKSYRYNVYKKIRLKVNFVHFFWYIIRVLAAGICIGHTTHNVCSIVTMGLNITIILTSYPLTVFGRCMVVNIVRLIYTRYSVEGHTQYNARHLLTVRRNFIRLLIYYHTMY